MYLIELFYLNTGHLERREKIEIKLKEIKGCVNEEMRGKLRVVVSEMKK
jgi:hypothetical protein